MARSRLDKSRTGTQKKLLVSNGSTGLNGTFYLSLFLPLELLPVDPVRVRLPLDSPESLRVRVPTCSFELALLTVLS